MKTWAHFKEWVSRNPALAPKIDTGKLLLLQAMHVQDVIHQRQKIGQQIPLLPINTGTISNTQPSGQVPQARGMPPLLPITPTDLQNLRAWLAPAQAALTDEKLRQFITTQRVAQCKKQLAMSASLVSELRKE